MRVMMRVQIPVQAGNDAVTSGRIAKIIGEAMERMRPEAAYFSTHDGNRGAYFVFDLADPSQVPVIAEPFFQGVDARIDFSPVMTLEDLQRGLADGSSS